MAVVILVATGLLLGGCTQRPTASGSFDPSSPSDPIPAADLATWIRFRVAYGLRADADWVLSVASDPRASREISRVPLLPDELESVLQANSSADTLVPIARRYADDFSTFAGAWLELPRVVLAFTEGVSDRRAEVDALFGSTVVIRQVQYSLVELQRFEDLVEAERAWLTSVGVRPIDIGLDEMLNAVKLAYEAPSEAVEAQIRDRLHQPDWLRLDWEGPPPWTGPFGRLAIVVVDRDGRPVAVDINLTPLDPRPLGFGPVFLEDGTFSHPAWAAVEWNIDVTYETSDGPRTITRRFTVPAGGVADVRVVVDR